MANNNQNPQQQKRVPVSINGYPEAVHDMMRAKYPDYDQVMGLGNQTMQGAPSGQTPAVAPQPMNMNVFQQNGGVTGKLEAPAIQTQQAQTAASSVQTPYLGDAAEKTQQPQTSFEGMQQPPTGWKADGTPSYDALSSALSGYQTAQSKQVPEFQADPSQRDGGFFGWLGKLIPKSRPGMREGETPDEYDRRITTNRERIAAFADAIRHMGNIVNTSKGAPLQVFNDPTAMMEEGYQKRKVQRQKQDAIDADAAYKQANLDLKSAAARADQAYKLYLAGLRGDNAQLAKDKFEYRKGKDAATAQYKQEKDKRDFEYKQGRDKVKDEQAMQRLAIQQYNATHKGRGGGGRSGKSGSGSGAKYWFEDKNGKMRYQPNKTMWEQEYYREYGKLPQGETSTSTSTKTINPKTGAEVTTTTRRKGASVTSQAAASQNAARNARNRQKPAGKSKNGYKNTKKLGL
nr:MAG: hypothetical protein [Bacteriophage sp.]